MRGRAFIIDADAAAAARQGSVIDDGDALSGDLLPESPAKAEVLLAVEIALKPVADGLVQQHARPARSQHDRHLAGRRLLGGERHELWSRAWRTAACQRSSPMKS